PIYDAGHLRRYYRFSIDREALARGPWCQGTVYVLPSDSFQATLGPDGQPTEEWCSAVPVRPVGRLVTEPSDFPLLQAVAGHDDADARRLVVLQLRMLLARPEPV